MHSSRTTYCPLAMAGPPCHGGVMPQCMLGYIPPGFGPCHAHPRWSMDDPSHVWAMDEPPPGQAPQLPPPINRVIDACESITWRPATALRAVIPNRCKACMGYQRFPAGTFHCFRDTCNTYANAMLRIRPPTLWDFIRHLSKTRVSVAFAKRTYVLLKKIYKKSFISDVFLFCHIFVKEHNLTGYPFVPFFHLKLKPSIHYMFVHLHVIRVVFTLHLTKKTLIFFPLYLCIHTAKVFLMNPKFIQLGWVFPLKRVRDSSFHFRPGRLVLQ